MAAKKTVRTIPATLNRFTKVAEQTKAKRKVAGYARVSTDHEEQQTSYEAQIDYYTNYIKSRDDWSFVDVYTDEGISATSTKRREGFNRMISDALAGKIDLIVTKSVSRFARNTVDSLSTIRKLKEHGTEVYFEKENIWTFDSKGELLITIMSSLAQEESRSISENCTWGQRKRFADGKASVPFKRFLGYDKGPNGEFIVNPEQAETVRLIYAWYLQGYSFQQICTELEAQGRKSPAGKSNWHVGTIKSVLTNEKYKGDALLQKKFTVDFLTKKQKVNEGEVPQYYVEGNHEAIIEPATFDMVQELMKTRQHWQRAYSTSIFSGKILCSECGSAYGSKTQHSNTPKYRKRVWYCNHKYDGEKRCQTPTIQEEQIKSGYLEAVNQLLKKRKRIIEVQEKILEEVLNTTALEQQKAELETEMELVSDMVDDYITRNSRVAIDQEEYQANYDSLVDRYNQAHSKYSEITGQLDEKNSHRILTNLYIENLKKQPEQVTEFTPELWFTLIDHATVQTNGQIKFTFQDGTEI